METISSLFLQDNRHLNKKAEEVGQKHRQNYCHSKGKDSHQILKFEVKGNYI
jgi:hypothetical protein